MEIDAPEFEKACGIGVEVSQDEIESAVASVISKHKDVILKQRYGVLIKKF